VPPLITAVIASPAEELKRIPMLKCAVIFIIVVCSSIIGLSLLQLQQSKAHELEQAEIASSNLARSMAQEAEDTFDEADIVLTGLAGWLQADGYGPGQADRLHEVFVERVKAIEQLHGLFFFDKNGQWVVTSFTGIPAEMNSSDRDYFIYHQNNDDLGPRIGHAIRSRATGEWVVPISRRINDREGHFNGVVLAAIRMSYFDKFFEGFDINKNGAMFIALTDGTLLARRPFNDALIGTSVAQGEILKNYLPRSSSGTAMITSVVDQTVRLCGYQQLKTYPLIVVAAISRDSILNEWQNNVYKSAAIIGAVLIINCLFGVLFIQQLRNGQRVETDLRSAKADLQVMATHDGLTGLANRRLFEETLNIEFKRGARTTLPISLIMLDIDYFKSFNDAYGHVAGDHCIAAVARVVRESLQREADLAVRYGGEEIAVLLPDTDEKGAFVIAEKIRLGVASEHIIHQRNPLGNLTISLGCYTCIPGVAGDIEQFIERADSALYSAKESGRNMSVSFSEATTEGSFHSEVHMNTDPKTQGGAHSPDSGSGMPDQDNDLPTEDENPPPQDWKHPDDGKSLSEQDEEFPLKP